MKSFLVYLAERLGEARNALAGIERTPGAERLDVALARALASLEADGAFLMLPPLRQLEPLLAYDDLLRDGVHSLLERIGAAAGTRNPDSLDPLCESAEHLAYAIERRADVFTIHGH